MQRESLKKLKMESRVYSCLFVFTPFCSRVNIFFYCGCFPSTGHCSITAAFVKDWPLNEFGSWHICYRLLSSSGFHSWFTKRVLRVSRCRQLAATLLINVAKWALVRIQTQTNWGNCAWTKWLIQVLSSCVTAGSHRQRKINTNPQHHPPPPPVRREEEWMTWEADGLKPCELFWKVAACAPMFSSQTQTERRDRTLRFLRAAKC